MYDAIRAAIAAIIYVAAVWAVARFFPGLPLLFLVALVGLPIVIGAIVRTWLWIVFCPLAVILVIFLTRTLGPTPVSVDPANPLVDALVTLASAALGTDFRAEARGLEALGLAGLSAEGMLAQVR